MSTQVLLVGRGLFLEGLTRLLENHQAAVKVIGSVESWPAAKDLLTTLQPDALIADYQCAETIIADIEKLATEAYPITKVLFIILDENRMVVYRRQQVADIAIHQLIEAL
jgi:DNA-binding NarL/FixJ family response regulator